MDNLQNNQGSNNRATFNVPVSPSNNFSNSSKKSIPFLKPIRSSSDNYYNQPVQKKVETTVPPIEPTPNPVPQVESQKATFTPPQTFNPQSFQAKREVINNPTPLNESAAVQTNREPINTPVPPEIKSEPVQSELPKDTVKANNEMQQRINNQFSSPSISNTPIPNPNQPIANQHIHLKDDSGGSKGKLLVTMISLIFLLVMGGAAAYYTDALSLFSKAPYDQSNFNELFPNNFSNITSANIVTELKIFVEDKGTSGDSLYELYDNLYDISEKDRTTLRNVVDELKSLRDYKKFIGHYPIMLHSQSEEFVYRRTGNKDGFQLIATFENPETIELMKEKNIKILVKDNSIVMFTEKSEEILLYPLTGPDPQKFTNLIDFIGKDFSFDSRIKTDINATNSETRTDFTALINFHDTIFNFDLNFGSDKENIYVKFNKFPLFGMGDFLPKGEWFKQKKKDFAEENSVPEITKEDLRTLLRYKVFSFKNEPEKVEDLYVYDVNIDFRQLKGLILELNNKLTKDEEERKKLEDEVNSFDLYTNENLMKYYDENLSIKMKVDKEGMLKEIDSYYILLSSSKDEKYNDKQVRTNVNIKLYGVNEPIQIELPTNAKDYEDLFNSGLQQEN